MNLRRRAVLLGTLAAGALGIRLGLGDGERGYIIGLLGEQFGAEISSSAAAGKFVDDFLARRRAQAPAFKNLRDEVVFDFGLLRTGAANRSRRQYDTHVLYSFLISTSVMSTLEGRSKFIYFGLYDPYARPCVNPLGHLYAG